MKKIFKICICMMLYLTFMGCSDFLERYPLDAINDKGYFTKEADFEFYMNGMYNGILRSLINKPLELNNGSDDVVTDEPHESLMRHSFSGLAPLNNKNWNDAYDYIRKCNYIINNVHKMNPLSSNANHFVGEAYFCRAFKYFELLQQFGGVPYIFTVLDEKDPELYHPRDSRSYVAEQILTDLDSAIVKMNWQGIGNAISGRLNKETALVFKTRVALFEGSWEYYHARRQTKFRVEGSDGGKFLEEVVKAGDILIAKHKNSIFKGVEGSEYFDLFNRESYDKIDGAFFYKIYSLNLNIKHNWGSVGNAGFGCGLTKDAVDSYLMKDGKPADISSIKMGGPRIDDYVMAKDPRLSQTIWYPGKGLFSDYWESYGLGFSYPGLIQSQQFMPSYSGYRIIKGCNYSASELLLNGGDSDDLLFRYGEALINYAEAKAILSTITQVDLDKTVNVLRSRVNMPGMNLDEINNWQIIYSKRQGYDPTASNIVNEIRREKRVEFMTEGLRVMDLKRWAVYDLVFNGLKPLGAYCEEFLEYWNAPQMKPSYKLIRGINVDEIDGFINPFFKNVDFQKNAGRGYYVDVNRDYLDAIPAEEISLYMKKAGVVLEQNPGWF